MRRSVILGLLLVSLILFGFYIFDSQASVGTPMEVGVIADRSESISNSDAKEISKPAQIYFLGDVMLARDVERRILQAGNDYPFSNISFPEESFVVANFESASPLIHVPTPNNTFRFSTRQDLLPLLKSLGITHASLANNHAYDYGLPGYNETVTALWDNSVVPFGHPTQLASTSVQYLETASGTVSVLAIHTLFSVPDNNKLSALLSSMRETSDWQVVYVHWGQEYVSKPNQPERALAKKMIAEGVDLIVGHHPHVVQSIERIDGALVLYSLGNFIFDQYFSTEVQQGLVIKLSFANGPQIELQPVTSELVRIQPQYMDTETKTAFLTSLASSSDPVLAADIIKGILPL
jgi:poly-gamma-glutamate synthesis protein (capsule biosynthesis protein)